MDHQDEYVPVGWFIPPEKEKMTIRQCKISKIQLEIEKHESRRGFAAKLTKLLNQNGYTYLNKLLEAPLSEIEKIKGIGQWSLDIIKEIRASYGILEEK